MEMTSAVASKLLKQLEEEKEFWVAKEAQSYIYVASVNETPVVPDYDYKEVSEKIYEIDMKIARIKHAINRANVNNTISVSGNEMPIDQILVTMAQKNKRKNMLDTMRVQQPKMRVTRHNYLDTISKDPEYTYINYDIDVVCADFKRLTKEIMEMQIALDRHNQTFLFEVDI